MPQGSLKPEPKVVAGGTAGAATIILIYIVGLFGIEMPAEVGSAITVLISFVAAYVKA